MSPDGVVAVVNFKKLCCYRFTFYTFNWWSSTMKSYLFLFAFKIVSFIYSFIALEWVPSGDFLCWYVIILLFLFTLWRRSRGVKSFTGIGSTYLLIAFNFWSLLRPVLICSSSVGHSMVDSSYCIFWISFVLIKYLFPLLIRLLLFLT